MAKTYRVVRMYRDGHFERVMSEGLTLKEAQEWCSNPETSSSTAKGEEARRHTAEYGDWFDGYEEEGQKPFKPAGSR